MRTLAILALLVGAAHADLTPTRITCSPPLVCTPSPLLSQGALSIDSSSLETTVEGVVDLQDLQGAVTDGQVPNSITIDLATSASDLTCTNCIGSTEIDGATLESEVEGVVDLQDLQGAVTDAQVPNTITVDLATSASDLTCTNCIGATEITDLALGTDTSGSYAAGDAEAGNATGVACTDCVALGSETTGNYAGSSSEGGAATTATALAANGGNCSAGQAAGGVDASGAVESCVDPIVNLGTDPAGTLPVANGGTNLTASSDDNVMVGNGTTWQSKALTNCPANAVTYNSSTNTFGCNTSPVRIDATSGVDCTGASDSTAGINSALTAAAGKTLFIPAGCRLGLASPGAGNAAVSVPSGANILCEDASAGFVALRQRCTGGTYPGAACVADGECLGGGTCDNDFNGTNASPCTGSSCFAPTGGSTYTMLKDAGGGSAITITNCSLWTSQADPYQRCVGGTNAGYPCRQECSGPSGTFSGFRCESTATHCTPLSAGTCLRIADCATPGGTCTGAPLSAVGAGKINPIDFTRTTNVVLQNVAIRDHFTGDWGIKVASLATLIDVNVAAEISNCTSPFATPTDSSCLGANAGNCCYGAVGGVSGANAQPTTAVTDGIVTSYNSILTRVKARGATNAINGAQDQRIEAATVLPAASTGPGTAGGGIAVTTDSAVSKSQIRFVKSGGTAISSSSNGILVIGNELGGAFTTGISLSGAQSQAIGNTITGSAYTAGILLGGSGSVADSNVVTSLGTASAIGISVTGASASVTNNFIEGNSTTGKGIQVGSSKGAVIGNKVISTAADTLQYGIVFSGSDVTATSNVISRVHDAGFWFNTGGAQFMLTANEVELASTHPTSTLQPVHILDDQTATQKVISGNVFTYGWRGFAAGTRTDGLTNTIIQNNRFVGLAGAPVAAGGAGLVFVNNYVNANAAFAGGPTLACDTQCAGGSPVSRGKLCGLDSDCTANSNTCANQDCVPEPIIGYVGSPTAVNAVAHESMAGNIMFDGRPNGYTKQCGGTATSAGALCQTAGNTCAGGGTCTGGSEPYKTCAGGSEAGRYCCTGGAPTCTIRQGTPYLRIADYNSAATHSQVMLVGNTIFGAAGATYTDTVMLDGVGSGQSATPPTLSGWGIIGNLFDGSSQTNTYGIKFPTAGTITDFNINGNNFRGLVDDVVNYKGTYGEVSFVPSMVAVASDQATITSTSFTNITALQAPILPSRVYDVYCHLLWTTTNVSEGINFALNGPASPTAVSGRIAICDSTNDCLATAGGTANYRAFHANAYDTSMTTMTATVTPSTTTRGAVLEFVVVNGTNAGNIAARVRAETGSGQSVTVKAGSFCRVSQMAKGT